MQDTVDIGVLCDCHLFGSRKTKEEGPPTGSLILMSFCGVTATANKLANLPIIEL